MRPVLSVCVAGCRWLPMSRPVHPLALTKTEKTGLASHVRCCTPLWKTASVFSLFVVLANSFWMFWYVHLPWLLSIQVKIKSEDCVHAWDLGHVWIAVVKVNGESVEGSIECVPGGVYMPWNLLAMEFTPDRNACWHQKWLLLHLGKRLFCFVSFTGYHLIGFHSIWSFYFHVPF